MFDPKLTGLNIGEGEIVSAEALHEGIDYANSFRQAMLADHALDATGRVIHPAPRFAEAVAYLTVEIPGHLSDSSPTIRKRFAEGFSKDPHITDLATIEWEVEKKGPQLIQVGFEFALGHFPFDFYEDIHWRANGIDGKGKLDIAHIDRDDPEGRLENAVKDIRGILITVRTF